MSAEKFLEVYPPVVYNLISLDRELEDSARLMEGNGKVHATIPFSEGIFTNPDFHTLIRLATEKARSRVNIGR